MTGRDWCARGGPDGLLSPLVRRLVLGLVVLLASGCGLPGRELLGVVAAGPPPPSPALRDTANHLDVRYRLGAPARLSSRVQAPDGQAWVVSDAAVRPTPGEYVLALDGTVVGPTADERRVLPRGEYQVVLKAETGSASQEATVPYTIGAADTAAPEIQDLTLLPDRISPNFDAIDDVSLVTYRLTKTARVAAFADQIQADGRRRRVWMGDASRTEAGEQSLQWDGVVNSQPLPPGQYEFGIRAEDSAGNVSEARRPVTIEDPGVPDAAIVSARIAPRQIIRGGQLYADITVRNTGPTVLRTQGPDPGYVYNSFDSYSSIEGRRFVDKAGFWRVGLAWSGSPDPGGAIYPYRWGFGHDLQPGEEVTVRGYVQIDDTQTKMNFFAGLVQEKVAIRNPGVGLTPVEISP